MPNPLEKKRRLVYNKYNCKCGIAAKPGHAEFSAPQDKIKKPLEVLLLW